MNVNFQQIYEDEIEEVTKELLTYPRHYNELTHEAQRFVEDLIAAEALRTGQRPQLERHMQLATRAVPSTQMHTGPSQALATP